MLIYPKEYPKDTAKCETNEYVGVHELIPFDALFSQNYVL
jgi:hypothetical protein